MAMPSNIIRVPKPARSSFNPNRPLTKNTLVKNQIEHFHKLERELPIEDQTGVDFATILTEGQASEYIGKLTRTLHSKGVREKERRYQELIERKYLTGLTAEDEIALKVLTEELSEIDGNFYRSVIERLKQRIPRTQTS